MSALFATSQRPGVSLSGAHEPKSTLDINPQGMNMNIELQAKMIEELLVKNSQLADENEVNREMRGPFNANDSADEGHPNTFGMPS